MSANAVRTPITNRNHHPFVTLGAPGGGRRAVDVLLAPVVKHCWRLSISTISCCQDAGEDLADLPASQPHMADYVKARAGRAYIDFATVEDAATFMTLVANGGARRGEFYDRMSHWCEPGAWDKTLILLDAQPASGRSAFAQCGVQLTFPKSDIPEITARLGRFSLADGSR